MGFFTFSLSKFWIKLVIDLYGLLCYRTLFRFAPPPNALSLKKKLMQFLPRYGHADRDIHRETIDVKQNLKHHPYLPPAVVLDFETVYREICSKCVPWDHYSLPGDSI